MQAQNSPVKEAIDLLINTKSEISLILSGPEQNMILVSVTSGLNSLINRLSHMAGLTAQSTPVVEFPPVTNFMGEELNIRKAPAAEEMEVKQSDKEKFLERVDKLFAEFDSLPADVIINAYSSANDLLVLRGVAKRAGIEDYQEAEITIPLIEKIAAGIKQKNADDAVQKQIAAEKKKADELEELQQQIAMAKGQGASLSEDIAKAKKTLDEAKPAGKPAAEATLKKLVELSDANVELQIKLDDQLKSLTA